MNTEYDVIVIGGGPAGCAAAVSAAREGSKTLLIEQTTILGGMATGGYVTAWCPYSDREKIIYRGLAERILNESKSKTIHVPAEQTDWVPLDPESLKVIYDNLMIEFGVDILFNTTFIDPIMKSDDTVSHIIVSNKGGMIAYQAKIFIDASGDGDLAVRAGADYEKGDAEGTIMPSSLCFLISNVELYAYQFHPQYGSVHGSMHPNNKKSFIHLLPADDRFPLIKDLHLCHNIVGPGTIGFNAGHIFNVDATDPLSVSAAIVTGRQIAKQFHDAMKLYFPEAFAGSYLVSTAPALGIRESRRIIGDYQLTTEDYLNKADFDDEICRNSYYLDIHYTEEEFKRFSAGEIDEAKRTARYAPGESHGIPYRALLPRGLKNVIVAGRSVSSDRNINGSVRVMPVCLAMGEAAGIAAHMATHAEADTRAIDVQSLREKLREYGAYFH